MAEMKNTFYEYTFEDGESVKMTLAFYFLYQLKNINKGLYERYNKIMMNGAKEEIEMITVLYTAYMCANITDAGNCMSEEEFMIKCGQDRLAVRNAVDELTKAKKQ